MPLLLAQAGRWLIPLPPVWLLGAAAALTILATLAAWGLLRLVSPRLATEVDVLGHDGPPLTAGISRGVVTVRGRVSALRGGGAAGFPRTGGVPVTFVARKGTPVRSAPASSTCRSRVRFALSS